MATIEPAQRPQPTAASAHLAGGAGLAAGLAAIVASSCCVLPLVFAGLGLGSVAAAVIPTLAALRPYLLGAAMLAVGLGWLALALRPRAPAGATCAPAARSRRATAWLALASAVVLLALLWQPVVEPRLLGWIR